MRIIGIDPGLRKTGWGIIEANGDNICQIANGTCDTKVSESLAFRLRSIFEKLTKVVKAYSPDHAAVENTFVNKDATNTLKLLFASLLMNDDWRIMAVLLLNR